MKNRLIGFCAAVLSLIWTGQAFAYGERACNETTSKAAVIAEVKRQYNDAQATYFKDLSVTNVDVGSYNWMTVLVIRANGKAFVFNASTVEKNDQSGCVAELRNDRSSILEVFKK